MLPILFIAAICSASLLSSSSLATCTNDGTDLNCTNKIVVVVTLESRQLNGTEELLFNLTRVDNGTDNLLLQTPIVISFNKSAVQTQYRLTYLQDFSYLAYEQIIYTSIFDCHDDFKASKATCGIATTANGSLIPDSQGFCCSCNFGEILDISNQLNRGKDCGKFNLGTGSSTASCLRFDPLMYSSYNIGKYQLSYSITADINKTDTIEISPQSPIKFKDGMRLTLVGDMYPTSPPPSISDKILLVPTSPPNQVKVLEGYTSWMLVSPDKITTDSSECNKIGVGYSAFKYQGDKCRVPAGSCLLNQIKNLYDNDMSRLKNKQSALYMIANYGKFNISKLSNGYVYLDFQYTGRHTSMVSLEIAADNIKFVTNVASATIVSIVAGNFEAMTNTGKAIITVNNTGKVVANFFVGIVNCTSGLKEIQAQSMSMTPNYSQDCEFVLSTENEKANNYSCIAYVSNANGDMTDMKQFNFSTTDKIIVNNQNGTNNTGGATTVNSTDKGVACKLKCSFYNIICMIINKCTSMILQLALYILLIIIGVKLIIVLIYKGVCCKKKNQPTSKSYKINNEIETVETPTPKREFSGCCTNSLMYYNLGSGHPLIMFANINVSFAVECNVKKSNGDITDVQFANKQFEMILGIVKRLLGDENLCNMMDSGINDGDITPDPYYPEYNNRTHMLLLRALSMKKAKESNIN